MVSFESAKATALALKPDANICREYDNAWEFDCKGDAAADGGMGPVVVLKEDGKAISLTAFLLRSDPNRYIDPVDDVIREFGV